MHIRFNIPNRAILLSICTETRKPDSQETFTSSRLSTLFDAQCWHLFLFFQRPNKPTPSSTRSAPIAKKRLSRDKNANENAHIVVKESFPIILSANVVSPIVQRDIVGAHDVVHGFRIATLATPAYASFAETIPYLRKKLAEIVTTNTFREKFGANIVELGIHPRSIADANVSFAETIPYHRKRLAEIVTTNTFQGKFGANIVELGIHPGSIADANVLLNVAKTGSSLQKESVANIFNLVDATTESGFHGDNNIIIKVIFRLYKDPIFILVVEAAPIIETCCSRPASQDSLKVVSQPTTRLRLPDVLTTP
ncbi:hypothetical protein K432DRAFT_447462 [Lepidopterella palustris CBS 459.81]|uniref:Uncharacterized protein n=1 Tax=Lepidopterella palustris CBS 459.81 TaxID=1314670 RepID=A0A8E2DYN3_9PEZI|nr:hypothetical protein K432DRAFT_447462 [Lepidopterella palustris CBS 459.81]